MISDIRWIRWTFCVLESSPSTLRTIEIGFANSELRPNDDPAATTPRFEFWRAETGTGFSDCSWWSIILKAVDDAIKMTIKQTQSKVLDNISASFQFATRQTSVNASADCNCGG